MSRPAGFAWTERKNGDVVITHERTVATVLRKGRARRFLDDIDSGADPQELMARLTGNYKRGNERRARNHPRNRAR